MEVELFTEEASEDENYDLDDKIEDYLDFDGERCGICMDIVIDRGVLDCCQHWFCFACIDNWATITSLCPLCQNEFQLITCVPVYDTVGGDKADEDTNPREDDWLVEEKTNTLSFPSYYIDENAVVCLDGDGCKIRSGSVAIEEDSDIDTSIACDSCDKWYHAFCVGFDPDGTCDGSWLCPRCPVDKVPHKSELGPISRQSYQHGLEIASSSGSRVEDSFSGIVSVSLADDGETAVVVSLIEGHQKSQESSEPVLGFSKDMNNTLWSNSTSHMPESKAVSDTRICMEPNSSLRELGISLSQDIDEKDNERAKDNEPESLEANICSEECSITADKIVSDNMEVIPLNSTVSDDKEPTVRTKSAKRKHREANNEAKSSQKKIKTATKTQPNCLKDQTLESVSEDSRTVSIRSILKDGKLKRPSQKENATPDIMAIVQGTERRSLKQLQCKTSSDANPVEGETASRLRLKKIMRRAGDDKDSSVLVQELREKIKETVRNKSCKEPGKNLFDPKLLDAFRAALAGPGTENRKQVLDLKAKQSMLQKGKTRESLTRKIYGAGGKRKRAWTRECEVEFWKHRCPKTSKTEKVETLKSVLDLLRDDSDNTKKIPGNEEQKGSTSILSRLYLADNSVFPRKNDICPVSAFNNAIAIPQKGESSLAEKICKSQPKNKTLTQVVVPPLDSKGIKKGNNGLKIPSEKEVVNKSDVAKGDKRKWALELLARKTATPGKNGQEEEDDNAVLKGNYPLLAQLQIDMRPVLAPARHNKISLSVRQTQLNRLTEHFLRKANLSKVCKTAEMELAVADAVNIEKEIANRSNSKLVYVNLCSQELSRRSKESNRCSNLEDSVRAKESNPCLNSEDPIDRVSEEANNSSLDLEVDEALRNAGLTSDSPPNSPNHSIEVINNEVDFLDEKEPDSILENDFHQDLDIYGDFEYNLEDDDFIGAGNIKISKLENEEPRIKLVFSSLIPEKPDETLDHLVHEADKDNSSCLLESQNKTVIAGESTEYCKTDDGSRVQNSLVDGNEELSLAECVELYGPDKEPIFIKYPETAINTTGKETVNNGLTGDHGSEHQGKDSGQTSEKYVEKTDSNCSTSKELPSDKQKAEKIKKEKKTTSDAKHSENNNTVMKKVEAYIKEHIRPLCKSGVITVDQYRWAVGKTTEKVMKYHSKEKNANFLIKEGEKVKKLAEQYVEAAPTHKGKN